MAIKENTTIRRLRNWNHQRLSRLESKRSGDLKPNNLAVLGMAKNEELNIDEWINHYLWQGADSIYIVDNDSNDSTPDKLKYLEASGKCKSISLQKPYMQTAHYWTAIKHFKIKENYQWLLIADLDEFWFCKRGISISSALKDYSKYGLLYCNWTEFGSSGFVEHPSELRIDLVNSTGKLSSHDHTKWICNTRMLRSQANIGVHKFYGVPSESVVSVNDDFQLNHYRTQSLHFWKNVKMVRGDSARQSHEKGRQMQEYEMRNRQADAPDYTLRNLLLKSRE